MTQPRRAVAVAVFALAVALGACGGGSGERGISAQDLTVLAANAAAREFRSTSTTGGTTVEIAGVVADDYRYRATVTVNQRQAYEEIVIDDRRYVRVADLSVLFAPDVIADLQTLHPAFTQIASGNWVVDDRGAPPEFQPPSKVVPLGPELVLARVRGLDSVDELRQRGLRPYNTDASSYLPKDDRFPRHPESGSRFDHVPRPFDPNATFSNLDSLRAFYEYVSIWATPEGVTRIERLTELPDPNDRRYRPLYDQLRRVAAPRLLALLERGDRTLVESYVSTAADEEPHIAAPEQAVAVDLVAALEQLRRRLADSTDTSPLHGPL